jgi:hypothetical protein
MEDLVIILVVTLGGTGATFLFIGNLIAVVTTIGINRYWGIASLFVPLLPVVFCFFHRKQAAYPLRLTAIGLALLSAALVISYGLYQYKFA